MAACCAERGARTTRIAYCCALCRRWQRFIPEGETDSVERADGSSSCGFHDGADVGVEVGGPGGAEAVGDLAEDDAGPERLFGAVVGCRDGAVFEEDEEVVSAFPDDALQLDAVSGGGRQPEQGVDAALQLGGVSAQGGIGEPVASPAVAAGAAQQLVQGGREHAVAGIDAYWVSRSRCARQT